MFENYEEVKKDLRVKLIPVEGNEGLLEKAVFRKIEDMALVYRVRVSDDGAMGVYIVVQQQELDHWGITAEQLHEDAMYAANENAEPFIASVGWMLGLGDEGPLYVVSTKEKCGAWAIFYPGAMKAYAQLLKVDGYYILPSSIHEVLLMPDNGITADELQLIVQDVNASVVEQDEQLTNSVYYYDASADVFSKVC